MELILIGGIGLSACIGTIIGTLIGFAKEAKERGIWN